MKQIFYLLLCLMIPALCKAQIWEMHADGTVTAQPSVFSDVRNQPRQESKVTVTINSTDAVMNAWFAISDNDKRFTMLRTPSKKVTVEVTPGTYSFGGIYMGGKPSMNMVAHEDVIVTSDTVLNVSKSMASILVKFEALNAAGNIPVLPFRSYKPDSTSYAGADVRSINVMNMLNYKGVSLGSLTGIETERKNGVDGTRSYDFRVNKVSKRFEFAQYRAYEALDGNLYLTFISGHGAEKDTTYYNNPADYKTLSVNFATLPTDSPDSLRDYKWGLYAKRVIDGKLEHTAGVRAFSNIDNPQMLVCTPHNGIPKDSAAILAQIFRPSVSFLKGKLHKYSGTLTQPLYYENGDWHSLDVGVCAMYGTDFSRFYKTEDIVNSDQSLYPDWNSSANKTCGFNLSKPYQPLLKGVPSVSVTPYKKGKKWMFYPLYVGRTGEIRDMDASTATYEVKDQTSGNVVKNGKGILEAESFENPVTITYINDNNIVRKGIKGVNKMELTFDMSKEDMCTPSLQMLFITDKNGYPTDSLADTDNLMIFSAGDFNYNTTKQIYTDSEASEISVEYAPNGTVDFTALSFQPINNSPLAHMIGRQYSVNMSQITKKSSNGWFDLRFVIKDAAGNRQTQLISPAFYIRSLKMGVEGVADDQVTVTGGKGKIIAPENAQVYTLTGILCGTDNLVPGVYIVIVGNKTIKTIVR